MDQSTFPLLLGVMLALACMSYLLRAVSPRAAHFVGWSSGATAALTFIAMVMVDAFQPELPGLLQGLAMPAPDERTKTYWAALWLHVMMGLVGGIYCLSKLMAFQNRSARAPRGA